MLLSHVQVAARNIPTEIQPFLTNPIVFNENISLGNNTTYNKSCIENGIYCINDITKEDGNVYTYDDLNTSYNVITFFTIFRSGKVLLGLEENIKIREHKK